MSDRIDTMETRSDTCWGREFDGLEARQESDLASLWHTAVASLGLARWGDVLQALAHCHASDPTRSTEVLELAGCIHLMRQEDLRGATARAHFALGHIADPAPWDALALQLSRLLDQQDDRPWAALALLNHSDDAALRRMVREGEVNEQWLRQEGLEELEALVFGRADDTQDHGWLAVSATLAAGDAKSESDEQRVLVAAKRSNLRNARAWGVELWVLFALDHDEAAFDLVSQALDTFRGEPRALLEILDTVSLDDELLPLLDAVRDAVPQWVRGRTATLPPEAPSEPGDDAHTFGSAVSALTKLRAMAAGPSLLEGGLILPEAPKRTDEDWLQRKEEGDKAFKSWLTRTMQIVVAVVTVGWIVYNLLA